MQHVIDGHSVFARDAFCSKPTVAIRNIKATNVLLNDRWINKLPIRKTKNTNPRYQKLTFWENHKRFEKITDLVPLEWKNHWLGVPRGGKIIDFLRKSRTWTPRGGKITDFLRKSLTWTPRGEKITDFLRKSLTWIPRGGKITDFLRKSLTWIPRGEKITDLDPTWWKNHWLFEKITDLDPSWWENHWLGPHVVRKSLTWTPRGEKITDLDPSGWKNHWLGSLGVEKSLTCVLRKSFTFMFSKVELPSSRCAILMDNGSVLPKNRNGVSTVGVLLSKIAMEIVDTYNILQFQHYLVFRSSLFFEKDTCFSKLNRSYGN